jgi:prepilin-type N-terminal cleavage/methylation domain-containing protein
MDMAKTRNNAGVTLVEMLVVVGIITLLAGFVVVLTSRMDHQSKERELAAVFVLLKSALIEYHEETGTFPVPDPNVAEEDFDEVEEHGELMYEKLDSVVASRQILRRVDASFIKGDASADDPLNVYDSWGMPLDYLYDPNTKNFPELLSAGPDEKFDTADDISSKDR